MKLVLAGSYVEFLDYCRDHGLDPQARPRTVRQVQSYADFMGLDQAEVILYGDYMRNPVYQTEGVWRFLMEYADSKGWKVIE